MPVLKFHGPASYQAAQRRLCRAVNTERRCPFGTRNRARQNDRTTIIQERKTLLHGEERSPDIDIKEFVEMRLRDLCQRGKFSHASVGEKHIDSPFHLADGIIEAIQVGQVRNVSLNAVNVASDYLRGRVQFLLAT